MRHNPILSVFAAVYFTLASGSICAAGKPAPLAPGTFTLDVEDGRLALRANTVPLLVLIRAVGARAGFDTKTTGDLSAPVTTSFASVPLIQGLQRLVGEISWVAHYSPSDGAAEPVPTLLWLHGPIKGEEIVELRSTTPDPLPTEEDKLRANAVLSQVNTASTAAALDNLAIALRTDESALVRSRAALGLGALGDERATPMLEASLDDPRGAVRMQAVSALGRIGRARATTALGEVLLHDPDRMQRIRAAWALRKQNTPLARDYLAALSGDSDQLVLGAAHAKFPAIAEGSPVNSQ